MKYDIRRIYCFIFTFIHMLIINTLVRYHVVILAVHAVTKTMDKNLW